jgi:hypothetical protein
MNKSVSFNLDDPDHVELLKHAEQRANFSEYVRSLIMIDMLRGRIGLLGELPTITVDSVETDTSSTDEDKQKLVIENSIDGFL